MSIKGWCWSILKSYATLLNWNWNCGLNFNDPWCLSTSFYFICNYLSSPAGTVLVFTKLQRLTVFFDSQTCPPSTTSIIPFWAAQAALCAECYPELADTWMQLPNNDTKPRCLSSLSPPLYLLQAPWCILHWVVRHKVCHILNTLLWQSWPLLLIFPYWLLFAFIPAELLNADMLMHMQVRFLDILPSIAQLFITLLTPSLLIQPVSSNTKGDPVCHPLLLWLLLLPFLLVLLHLLGQNYTLPYFNSHCWLEAMYFFNECWGVKCGKMLFTVFSDHTMRSSWVTQS